VYRTLRNINVILVAVLPAVDWGHVFFVHETVSYKYRCVCYMSLD